MKWLGILIVPSAIVLALPAAGQIPPGYEVVQITNTPLTEFFPEINNRGQIVFAVTLGTGNSTVEISGQDAVCEILDLTNARLTIKGVTLTLGGSSDTESELKGVGTIRRQFPS